MIQQQIIITIKADGDVDVSGPLHDKVLCFGLLTLAEHIIKDYKPNAIVAPTNGDINRIKQD